MMKQLKLSGEWNFKSTKNNNWSKGTVPGCNYLDLMATNEIPDPFYGTNEKDLYWVAQQDWEYKKSFEVNFDFLEYDSIELYAKQLDTICDIILNGKKIAYGNNAHIEYHFDIKPYLIKGENELIIKFYSPVNWVKDMQKKEQCPLNSNGQNGIPHIRKPQCHFGWDWGPVLPLSGITKDIFINFVKDAKIKDFSVFQSHKNGKVDLTFDCETEQWGKKSCSALIEVTTPSREIISKSVSLDEVKNTTITIENPELWWTFDLSEKDEQPLYKIDFSLMSDGKKVHTASKSIGLRTIELNQNKDEYGTNFQFVLNGVPLFIKGSNLIPPDSFMPRFDEIKLNYLIDAVLFSNMNMIRIWGGGYYGSDELYDICDKKGILLWQDFPFACQAYPFFIDEFRENVLNEVELNVKRLMHHPSLALWCGNNEIESMSGAWIYKQKYIEWTEKFFWHILKEKVEGIDNITPYIAGTPVGAAHMKGVDKDNVGDTHLWAVWHGLQPMDYYKKRPTRFCSEYGFESLPDIKTIKTFATESDYSLESPVFLAHQKCSSGNMRMLYYIATRFNIPKHFKDFIYLSQVTQEHCIGNAAEFWRRNRGRCNGAIYWQLNDCWSVCSWASMDYYGNYKALQYTARHFFAPQMVSIDSENGNIFVYVVNDKNKSYNFTLKVSIFDFKNGIKEQISKDIVSNPLSSKKFCSISSKKLKNYNKKETGVVAELILGKNVINRKVFLFDDEKKLNLPKATISKNVEIQNDELVVTLRSNNFARLVSVSNCSSTHFSDNFFDMLPNETIKIAQKINSDFSAEELINSVKTKSCCDIEQEGNAVSDFIKRSKVMLRPDCFFTYIYEKKPNKPYKE